MQDDATVSGVPKDFVHRYLPWVVAAVALLVFVLTLNRWPTYIGLPTLARVAGWDWRPSIYGPVQFLATYPIRWLPAAWQLLALNLFSAGCASLALALLARSVSLLPHDRTKDQRLLERNDYSLLSVPTAWLPPVFAALVCGLQLSFWENAVVATAEALDLLFFAYVIRCLLEFRIDARESWLAKAVLVYALGMTNNAAMVGFFPAWLIALLWVKGRSFFDWRFLLRMAAIGLAGLLLYLLLPAMASFSGLINQSFGEILRSVLGYQKTVLLSVPRYMVLLMSLTSLAPVLFMGIRWPAQFGDISAAGNYLTNLMTHVIHGIFLAACLYVAFDPPFSPRQLAGGMFAFLPFYYLGALAIGYCSGYFLLVFGRKPELKPWQRSPRLRQAINYAVVAAVGAAFVAAPVGLVRQNLPELRRTQARELSEFSKAAARELPAGAVVLSDETFRLHALRAALAATGSTGRDVMLIDASALPNPAYHAWLRGRYPDWPALPAARPGAIVEPATLAGLVSSLAQKRPLFYLQPTFGYYMETFYLRPRGALYELVRLPTNSVSPPAFKAEELQPSAEFWRKFKTDHLGGLIQAVKPVPVKSRTKKQAQVSPLILYAASVFSRGMNFLGVQFQKSGDLEKAAEFFGYALELNPDNPCAFINQEFNAVLRGQGTAQAGPSEGVKTRLAPYRGNWDNILSLNGPVDEPNTCFLLAKTYSTTGLSRQAAQLLERALALAPGDPSIRLSLANAYTATGLPDRALALVAALRAERPATNLTTVAELALTQAEAWAYVAKNDVPTAEKLLLAVQQRFPQEPGAFGPLVEIYRSLGRNQDALNLLERQIKLQPNNPNALLNLAALHMSEGAHEKALPLLDAALKLQPAFFGARFNRAIAHLSLGRLDQAQSDYEALELMSQTPDPRLYYGLGEVFTAKKMRKKAIEQYEKYLKTAPDNTPEAKLVRDRLKALKSGKF
jgi:Flp pilus assembly protein TadD